MTMPSVGGGAHKPSRAWSQRSFTARCTARRKVLLTTSFFEKLAKTMASGMLRPDAFRIFRTACSTFF